MAQLRKGKTRNTLESSIDSALLAVEVYNKPRTAFRVQGFVTLMIISWTRLFHAYFHHTIGDRFYYKKKGRYELVDGERKAWDLKTCLQKYSQISEPVRANLNFFIGLRNKIEHRNIEKHEIDTLIFGECQAFLYNYESTLISIFGPEYSLNENLVYSLQFSTLRTSGQITASKRALSTEVKEIKNYVEKYRISLPEEVFNSQEYSLKLIQIPKISNTNRGDLAIEFVRWDSLNDSDKAAYQKLTAIIKNKVVRKEAVNVGRLKPGAVLNSLKKKTGSVLSHHDHKCLYTIFKIRPASISEEDPFETDTRYCHYDEVHRDYVFQEAWVDCLAAILNANKIKKYMWTQAFRQGRRYKLEDYI